MSEATLTPDKIEGAIEVLQPWTTLKHWPWSFQGKRAIELALLTLRTELARLREPKPSPPLRAVPPIGTRVRFEETGCVVVIEEFRETEVVARDDTGFEWRIPPADFFDGRLSLVNAQPRGVARLQSLYSEHRQALPLAFVREFPAAMTLIEETLAALCADRLELEKLRRVKYLADCPPAAPLEAMATLRGMLNARAKHEPVVGELDCSFEALSEIEDFVKAVSR
jgi:hypothetical protein